MVARFLERLWRDPRPHRKTDLQMAVRLNYNVYKKYVEWLLAKGFIEIRPDEDGERVLITPHGVATYKTLVTWIKETIGDDHL